MERIRSLTGVAAAVLVACGCTATNPFVKKPAEMPQPTRPPGDNLDAGVKQASATVPAGPSALSGLSLGKLTGKAPDKPKGGPVMEMTVLWQPRLAYLTEIKSGQPQCGLTGNLFLYGPGMQPAAPNGTLTVMMYDETPRPGGVSPAPKEGWKIDKEQLARQASNHELLGRSYVLFLPLSSYRADMTRVRLAVRYEPEQGFPYTTTSSLTIDTSAPAGSPVWTGTTQQVMPGQTPPGQLPPGFGPSPLGGPPPAGLPPTTGALPPTAGGVVPTAGFAPPAGNVVPAAGFGPAMAGAVPAGGPMMPVPPAGAGAGPAAVPLLPPPGTMQVPPGGLPPIVITPQMRGQ